MNNDGLRDPSVIKEKEKEILREIEMEQQELWHREMKINLSIYQQENRKKIWGPREGTVQVLELKNKNWLEEIYGSSWGEYQYQYFMETNQHSSRAYEEYKSRLEREFDRSHRRLAVYIEQLDGFRLKQYGNTKGCFDHKFEKTTSIS